MRVAAVQILQAIRFFISQRFIYERSATNIRDWPLAYSFIIYIFSGQFNTLLQILLMLLNLSKLYNIKYSTTTKNSIDWSYTRYHLPLQYFDFSAEKSETFRPFMKL